MTPQAERGQLRRLREHGPTTNTAVCSGNTSLTSLYLRGSAWEGGKAHSPWTPAYSQENYFHGRDCSNNSNQSNINRALKSSTSNRPTLARSFTLSPLNASDE